MSRGEPLIRQWNLLKALQSHYFGVGVDELAQRLVCSKRQVQRDLGVLQQVGFPVSYEARDLGKRFWKLDQSFIQKQELVLSVTELLSLFLSRQLLSPLSGTQFGDGLSTTLDKIKALLPKKALRYFDGLDENLLVKSIASHDYSGQDKQIAIINQAMDQSRVLKVRYQSASQKKLLSTLFHPYGLVFFGTNLYCIGYMVQYEEIRTLKVSRFQGVEITADHFQKPERFSLKTYTGGSFGIIHSDTYQTIKVRFTGWAATNVREHKWHPSQKILKDCTRRGGEDCVEAEFELSDTMEFKRWLLGFGRCAVVLSPKKLADDLKSEFRASCKSYGIQCPRGS